MTDNQSMEDTYLEEIHGFVSPGEFSRFVKWIENEVTSGFAREISVNNSYSGLSFNERWFCYNSIGEVWRLVYPDFPFRGYWGKVQADQLTKRTKQHWFFRLFRR
jgi:hypothetical protein